MRVSPPSSVPSSVASSPTKTSPGNVTKGNVEEGLFEGCGREGPILAIFLAEFHHTLGPKIVYQYPPDVISKENFDAVTSYIIPKTHLQRITMTVNVLGKKIIGYPIQIPNDKYERNAFYFNTCFVANAWARTVQYENVLVKLAQFFYTLELETEYLSRNSELGDELEDMFSKILRGLNDPARECFYVFKERLLALKVVPAVLADPPKIEEYEVPVFIVEVGPSEKWDLTTQQIIPYMDGFNHVAQISHLSDVHINLVKSCVQNLLYYNVVKLVPAFQYANSYYLTSHFHTKLIQGDDRFKNECLFFVAKNDHTKPNFVDVLRFYGSMKRGVTMKELCLRFKLIAAMPALRFINLDGAKFPSKYSDPSLSSSVQSRNSSNPTTPVKEPLIRTISKRPSGDKFQSVLSVIDERRLVLFGMVHDLIRRVEKYPVLDSTDREMSRVMSYSFGSPHRSIDMEPSGLPIELRSQWEKHRRKHAAIYEMLNGKNSYDKICLTNEISQNQLEEIIERDPDVCVCSK